jgi:hypothetical protein
MSCERYRDALTDLAAGAPAPVGVEGHLASCEACRAELAALRRALAEADAEMAGLLAAEASPELPALIRSAVAESEASKAWRSGWLWTATAVAATLLVALAVALGRGTGPVPGARVAEEATSPAPGGTGRGEDSTREPRALEFAADLSAPPPRLRVTGSHTTPAEPEVLVPPGEAEALVLFAAQLRARSVSPDSLLAADLTAPLAEPSAVEISPLEIVPLDPAETSGTD